MKLCTLVYRAFNCRILYDHYLPTVILIIIGIPSPNHSFTLGLNPFPDCLLLLLSIFVFLLSSFFLFYTLLVVGSVIFRAVD